jgi:hypothetical protein
MPSTTTVESQLAMTQFLSEHEAQLCIRRWGLIRQLYYQFVALGHEGVTEEVFKKAAVRYRKVHNIVVRRAVGTYYDRRLVGPPICECEEWVHEKY